MQQPSQRFINISLAYILLFLYQPFDNRLQCRNIYRNGIPQLFRPNLIVAMHKYMPHTLYIIPVYFAVAGSKLKR